MIHNGKLIWEMREGYLRYDPPRKSEQWDEWQKLKQKHEEKENENDNGTIQGKRKD